MITIHIAGLSKRKRRHVQQQVTPASTRRDASNFDTSGVDEKLGGMQMRRIRRTVIVIIVVDIIIV